VTAVQAGAGEMVGPQRLAQALAPLAQVGVAEVLARGCSPRLVLKLVQPVRPTLRALPLAEVAQARQVAASTLVWVGQPVPRAAANSPAGVAAAVSAQVGVVGEAAVARIWASAAAQVAAVATC
jgi:hypothetical protein